MKKILLIATLVCFLNGCAYNPIIDTAGKSGTFNTDQAKEITNDLQHCKTIADNNTDFIGNIIYWILPFSPSPSSLLPTSLVILFIG
jgi:hypothetical protein